MDLEAFRRVQARRRFLQHGAGVGMAALWHLLALDGRLGFSRDSTSYVNPLLPKSPHFAPRTKNVIYLYMAGAPSQIDLFDPKPELNKWEGQSLPESMTKDMRLAFIKPTAKIWASPRVFSKHGQCGMEFSDYLPHTATCADQICMIRSMYTEQFNHLPGNLMMNCGTPLAGRPSMGSWITYGLGSESDDMPGYVVLISGFGEAGSKCWSNGFLSPSYQGVPFRSVGEPVLYLTSPAGISQETQRARLDILRDLNHEHSVDTGDVEIASRIASYELAFRMQTAAPELLDLSKEPAHILDKYGINNNPDPSALPSAVQSRKYTTRFAMNCLLARRMVEKGVRFVHLFHGSWDDHTELNKKLKSNCEMTDQPVAALLTDLKQRGLLDTTLVIWGGEFGRTPMVETSRVLDGGADNRGRDHQPSAFTVWMAGGGVKGGQVIGKTDELGLNVVKDKVHVHDLQATVLHCLGLDHKRLTYGHQGREFRLTDVGGNVIERVLK